MDTNSTPNRPIRILPTLIIAAVAITAGILAAQALLKSKPPVDDLAASRFPVARQLEPFSLVDHQGNVFDNAALRGHWSFLFFGYTHCPDVCPTTLSVLNSVAGKLADSNIPVRFALVSVDPQRDTPEQLARFVTYFNSAFIGVTGSDEGIEQLTRQLGIMHMQVTDESTPDSYLIDHTAAVLLIDPNGNYHAVFTPPLSADAIAGDFRKMLRDFQ
jgi:protein SCO1/2